MKHYLALGLTVMVLGCSAQPEQETHTHSDSITTSKQDSSNTPPNEKPNHFKRYTDKLGTTHIKDIDDLRASMGLK